MDLQTLTETIKNINTHIAVLNDDSVKIWIEMTKMQTDLAWLKRFFFIIITAVSGNPTVEKKGSPLAKSTSTSTG